jgi:hypothetical protein
MSGACGGRLKRGFRHPELVEEPVLEATPKESHATSGRTGPPQVEWLTVSPAFD